MPNHPHGKHPIFWNSSRYFTTTCSPSRTGSEWSVSATNSEQIFRGDSRGPLAVYLHFPFCKNLCSYCDFYKTKYDRDIVGRYFQAIEYETETVFSLIGYEPIDIASIYIGGGTPSLADPKRLGNLLDLIKSYATFLPGCEITVEVNPEGFDDNFARQVFAIGVNRLVLGVQSFEIGLLKNLNRFQSIRDIYRAFYMARMAGFENIAADLIFGLPGQKIKQVKTDIERLMALKPNHISFYQLTVEKDTPLSLGIEKGSIILPDEQTISEMYRFGSHMLIDGGYKRYEVSSFAPETHRSRHNSSYWTGSYYLGLGPAAHGFINGYRYGNIANLNQYLEITESGRSPIDFVERLTEKQSLTEAIMLSLRTAAGIDKKRLIFRFGSKAIDILESSAANRLVESDHLINDSGFLRLTDKGFLLVDQIIADLAVLI